MLRYYIIGNRIKLKNKISKIFSDVKPSMVVITKKLRAVYRTQSEWNMFMKKLNFINNYLHVYIAER